MKAMILAAGLGTRLAPLTDITPKALMPVVNIPIIVRNINYLKMFGINKIAVNTYHHYQKILDYLDSGRPFDIDMDVRVEHEILGTGGGIGNFRDFLCNGSFIVINSDILTNIDLTNACEFHKRSGNIATMILHFREPFNQVLIDSKHRIIEINQENSPDKLAFTGIHIMEPDLLQYIPDRGYSNIMDCYRKLIQSGRSIGAYISEQHYWHDIGTLDGYINANKQVLGTDRPFSIGPGAYVAPSAILEEWAIIGEKACVEDGAKISRSILWDNVRVKDGTRITDSVVTSFKRVDSDIINKIY